MIRSLVQILFMLLVLAVIGIVGLVIFEFIIDTICWLLVVIYNAINAT